ncbi:ABC transporter substrate-binding protein [Bradyrhizobium elkanii]|uniref:ABC transporter substrate-binding protein n=1 Tax=Bradyrhizobium elkanii TaxID=29448 RepID=UPI001BAADAF6|nr:ABC transporter substrate-binding protein [Bradyrhizobium elkanii]MBR1165236.1 ABC transporter substrate-binding protein [Bradyrhizobium elkanii]
MAEEKFDSDSHRRVSRRTLLQAAPSLLSLPFITKSTSVWAQENLSGTGEVVVQSYGGPATEAIRRAVNDPFTKATGIKVVDVTVDAAEPQIAAMFRAGRVDWDIAEIQALKYAEMRAAGMFEPIDYNLWDLESLEGVPKNACLESAVSRYSAGIAMAYNARAFPEGSPRTWADFWDVKRFPGPRSLSARFPRYNLVFALSADGVAPQDIWPLTDEKIDRAFKKLNSIKPHIVKWWAAGGEPVQLLLNGECALASAFDGRLLSATRKGAPIKFSWEASSLTQNSALAVILKGGPNTKNAQKLVAFMNRAKVAAAFTESTLFPAPNINQLKYVPADLVALLSINPANASKAVPQDVAWLSATRPDGKTNDAYLEERWLAWRTS